ncbi:MAG: hypothetical protein GXC76_06960 [Rhodanobacteraceae bacterium]|nr:hypothetical protein [Rhodanobacteraceae bacterium]
MKRTIFALLAVTASLLAGCGSLLHKRQDTGYLKSVQERPLEVPPDLTMPNSSAALTIPAVGATTAPAATAGTAPADATPSALPPPAPGVALAGAGLQVADTVDSTWTRVGLALERSGAATILGRDEAAHAYTVETTGQAASEAGWFKRAITLGRAGGKTTAKVQLTVRVSADGADKSTVNVEGGSDAASQDAARTLLAALRERLS